MTILGGEWGMLGFAEKSGLHLGGMWGGRRKQFPTPQDSKGWVEKTSEKLSPPSLPFVCDGGSGSIKMSK